MARNNTQNETKSRAILASITSLSIFIALSAGIIGFLVIQATFEFGYNAATVACGSFIFAISMFLLSLEFFIMGIFHSDHIDYFGFIGSCLYGIGLMSMIVGIALALMTFGMCILSYSFLTLLLVGYGIYYGIRVKRVGVESPCVWRVSLRVIYFLILVAGYFLLSTVGG